MATVIATMWSLLYSLPRAMGYGDQWPLTPEEAELLGEGTDACLKTLPRSKRATMAKVLQSYAPWLMLATTLYTVTYPRVKLVQWANAESKSSGAGAGVAASGNGHGNTKGVRSYARYTPHSQTRDVRSWADYRATG